MGLSMLYKEVLSASLITRQDVSIEVVNLLARREPEVEAT
jgi:hypothetical protein